MRHFFSCNVVTEVEECDTTGAEQDYYCLFPKIDTDEEPAIDRR